MGSTTTATMAAALPPSPPHSPPSINPTAKDLASEPTISAVTTEARGAAAATEDFKLITVKPLHPTFVAEITGGIDFTKPVPADVFEEIRRAAVKYGVLVFRGTPLTNETHVAFSALFGPLDDIKPYLTAGRTNRFAPYDHIFDVSNIEDDGTLAPSGGRRHELTKGNSLFHVDSSFNPRRAGYSLLLAHELPPRGTGGATLFADTRTAYDELPEALKQHLLQHDYIAAHNLWHSRKKASPTFFAAVDPTTSFMSRHKLVQTHEASGRPTLYIASHIHHLEGIADDAPHESTALVDELLAHASRDRYVYKFEWENEGDLVLWDNMAVMHRAAGGAYEGVYRRDMRRTTLHDTSSNAWGLNEKSDVRTGLP